MGISDLRDIDREDVSDFVWKWRCKILHRGDAGLTITNMKPIDADSSTTDDSNSNSAAVPVPAKDPTFGVDTTIKTMYEGRNSDSTHFEWVDYPPKQLSKSAARAQDRVAIKVYKIKDREKQCVGGRFPLKYHQIEIQNPQLVAALEPILKKENVYLDVHDTADFTQPFRGLWFCQDEIKALYRETAAEDSLKGYLHLLLHLLEDMFSDMRTKRRHLLSSGLIDFKTAWTLFPRGSTVYSYGLNSEFICKVEDTEYVKKNEGQFLVIKAKIMTFNGEEFVWHDKNLAIPEFSGNTPITELRHYPFDFHQDKDAIMKRLVARGNKVLDLQGLKYSCYNGIALHDGEKQCIEKHNVEGRVLIDVVGYNKYHLALGKRENKDPETSRNQVRRGRRRPRDEEEEDEGGSKGPKTQQKRLSEKMQRRNKEEMLEKPEELAFMSEMIGGYALKNKLWVQFYVEDIESMVWNAHAFDHLVYDDQQKDLVLSFVENHTLTKGSSAAMEDVIVGKGQGLIILLSGPPGTGKTLTAEAVADRTKRPLFYLQAEDLGINAATLGANIKRVFEMATEWNAVILLDEADVFMAERNPNDIHRNELVSIFLRELEYFRGIIFLTTNLYHTIDSAFRSRVSLHLLFQALTREARESIWQKFLQRLPSPQIKDVTSEEDHPTSASSGSHEKPLDDEDVKELALWQLNGREIKNAVKMVRSWCDHKGYVMTLSRLENGIKVTSPHASKDGDVDKDLYD
ncbi:P-loop containing nucleoside triphosphate hydrolase protein [Thelonectria olida]|uniref:P-loop containing nucleoside triphosphate hydrolase protein n=1 Tax=Thelonectria olida TaxID=1576542 RepID=A0A9P9AKW9_9HYPO|nr:P-loop containing nucleoside triphosphate hydrolase protein [Thelonectria olida]